MKFKDLPKSYIELCKVWLPRPIKTSAQYDLVDALYLAMENRKLSRDQRDYFQVLDWALEEHETKLMRKGLKRFEVGQ